MFCLLCVNVSCIWREVQFIQRTVAPWLRYAQFILLYVAFIHLYIVKTILTILCILLFIFFPQKITASYYNILILSWLIFKTNFTKIRWNDKTTEWQFSMIILNSRFTSLRPWSRNLNLKAFPHFSSFVHWHLFNVLKSFTSNGILFLVSTSFIR